MSPLDWEEMTEFTGRLHGPDHELSTALIEIREGRVHLSKGRAHLGSWALDQVQAERTSIYRFALDMAGDRFEFTPDDPSKFSEAVGAVIDLTESKGRFGLKQRLDSQGDV